MKEIIFSNKERILLTDSEFVEAVNVWNQNKDYWCIRLEILISHGKYLYCRTPKEDFGFEVLINTRNGEKIYQKNNKFYLVGENAETGKIIHQEILGGETKDGFVASGFVPQDEYYSKYVRGISSSTRLLNGTQMAK